MKQDAIAAVFVEMKELGSLSTSSAIRCYANKNQFEHDKTTVSLRSDSKV